MARKNYQANEAYDIIKNRFNDPDTYVDFVKKFPGFAGVILSGDMETLCKGIPFGSARQFDKSIWGVLSGEVEAEEEETETSSEEDGEKEGDGDSKYAGMSPKKLFALCQKAGLKVKEKQPAEYYIEKLEYADKKEGTGKKAAVEPEDDDWDDEDEDEKPAKGKDKAKKTAKKAKKPEPEVEADDDDDDDWDF
jgi:hypothetical protein